MDVLLRMQRLTQALRSTEPLAEAAQKHGVSIEELELWAALHEASAATQARRSKRLRRVGMVVVACLAFASISLATRALAAGTCSQTLPAPLITFCPDEPALASEVNDNFAQLRSWILAPPAAVSATSSITAAGAISTPGAMSSGTMATGLLLVNGPGQGAQVAWNTITPGAGQYELINNRGLGGGGFAVYERNGPADAIASTLLRMDRVKANFVGAVGGNGALCVVPANCEDSLSFGCGGSAVCPNNKFMVGFTDGTSCSVPNKARCCSFQLVACP